LGEREDIAIGNDVCQDAAMKILVLTNHSEKIAEWNDLTEPNKREYCERHGYGFENFKVQYEDYLVGLRLLRERVIENDLVMAMGCDTIFTNFDKKIEDVQGSEKRVTISEEYFNHDVFNNDVIIFPNSDESLRVIDLVIKDEPIWKHKRFFWQTHLSDLYKAGGLRDVINVVGARVMNSCHQDNSVLSRWQEGDWVLHAMGWDSLTRIKILKHYLGLVKK
jgi:hypothetical protein